MMNVFSFCNEVIDDNDTLALMPCIDGVPLDAMVEAFEKRQGYKDPAGGYGGVVPDTYRFGSFLKYFMGEEGAYGHPLGTVFVLFCSCGEALCWPLQAQITAEGSKVIWSGFKQPHRPTRDYSAFGPFEFHKDQYEAAVIEAASLDIFN